jgi:hypothetical protein
MMKAWDQGTQLRRVLFPPSVNPQLTEAWQTVESRFNRNELSGVPTARIRRWNNGHNLSRKQSEKDLTTDDTDRTDKRSEMPFIRPGAPGSVKSVVVHF